MNNKTLAKMIRTKTGLSISQISRNTKVSREIFYRSMSGKGSRRIRVKISIIIGLSPSIIWPKNKVDVRVIDDLRFMESQR